MTCDISYFAKLFFINLAKYSFQLSSRNVFSSRQIQNFYDIAQIIERMGRALDRTLEWAKAEGLM